MMTAREFDRGIAAARVLWDRSTNKEFRLFARNAPLEGILEKCIVVPLEYTNEDVNSLQETLDQAFIGTELMVKRFYLGWATYKVLLSKSDFVQTTFCECVHCKSLSVSPFGLRYTICEKCYDEENHV